MNRATYKTSNLHSGSYSEHSKHLKAPAAGRLKVFAKRGQGFKHRTAMLQIQLVAREDDLTLQPLDCMFGVLFPHSVPFNNITDYFFSFQNWNQT